MGLAEPLAEDVTYFCRCDLCRCSFLAAPPLQKSTWLSSRVEKDDAMTMKTIGMRSLTTTMTVMLLMMMMIMMMMMMMMMTAADAGAEQERTAYLALNCNLLARLFGPWSPANVPIIANDGGK